MMPVGQDLYGHCAACCPSLPAQLRPVCCVVFLSIVKISLEVGKLFPSYITGACNGYINCDSESCQKVTPVEAPTFNDRNFSIDCKYLHVFLFVIFLVHAKKFPILVTSDKLLLWIALWCTSNVATASPGQERHARDAWNEIRRLPPTRVEGDYSIFEHHHVRTNKKTGEYYTLSYKLRRHRSLYVNLDDKSLNIQQVFCTEDALRLVVASEMALEAQLKLWTYPESTVGRLIYGGQRWGCGVSKSTPTGSPLFRSMTGPAFFNAANKTFIIPTHEASPFAFFGSGNMHYFSNESTGLETDYQEGISGDYTESTRSETDLQEGTSKDSRRKMENVAANADVDHPGQGAKNRAFGKFPEGEDEWGLGGDIEFNYNYNKETQTADTQRITLADTSDYSIYCDTCYMYLNAGVGFEFQTEAFSIAPSYLVYMKIWVGGTATYSFNGNMEAKRKVTYSPEATTNNFLLNAKDKKRILESTNFRSLNIINFPDLTGQDLSQTGFLWKQNYMLAGIETSAGIKLPVFASVAIDASAAGSVSKMSYYSAKEEYGIGYLNPNTKASECTMSGCQSLKNSESTKCESSGWCKISKSEHRQGGTEPSSSFSGYAKATFQIHPVVSMCLFVTATSCMLSGFVETRISVLAEIPAARRSITSDKTSAQALTALVAASHGTNGAGAEAAHLRSCGSGKVKMDLKVKMDMYAWAKAELAFGGQTLASVESGVTTVFLSDYYLMWSGCATATAAPVTISGSLCGASESTASSSSTGGSIASSASKQVPAGSKQCTLASGGTSKIRRSAANFTNFSYGAHFCVDDNLWTDKNGKGCSYYEQNQAFCSEFLVRFYANPVGKSAEDACCVCRGGTRVCQTQNWVFPCFPPESKVQSLSAGVIGAIVGGIVGFLIVLAAVYYLWRRTKISKEDTAAPTLNADIGFSPGDRPGELHESEPSVEQPPQVTQPAELVSVCFKRRLPLCAFFCLSLSATYDDA
jgi:hypothetical protein